jgi:hypothetical protein
VVGDVPELGTKYTYVAPMGPFAMRGKMETVVFESPEHIEWQGETILMKWLARCSFKSVEGGTQLTMKTDFYGKGIFRLLEPMLKNPFKKSYDEQFQKLKQLLES